MDRLQPGVAAPTSADADVSRTAALAALDDLHDAAADLGWDEATGLVDALVDHLAHLLVDLADGATTPTRRPVVVGAIGGPARPVDHASCRTAAAALRRVERVLRAGAPGWAPAAGDVALDLSELLDQVADRHRTGRLTPSDKSVVLRRVNVLARRLRALT